eukprot:365645-Chlamydomonas_euryale.AAC.5
MAAGPSCLLALSPITSGRIDRSQSEAPSARARVPGCAPRAVTTIARALRGARWQLGRWQGRDFDAARAHADCGVAPSHRQSAPDARNRGGFRVALAACYAHYRGRRIGGGVVCGVISLCARVRALGRQLGGRDRACRTLSLPPFPPPLSPVRPLSCSSPPLLPVVSVRARAGRAAQRPCACVAGRPPRPDSGTSARTQDGLGR